MALVHPRRKRVLADGSDPPLRVPAVGQRTAGHPITLYDPLKTKPLGDAHDIEDRRSLQPSALSLQPVPIRLSPSMFCSFIIYFLRHYCYACYL